MAYSTTVNIQSEFPHHTFNTTDRPTLTDVTALIAESDQEIDSALRDLHSVPITNANDLIFLRRISKNLTVGKVGKILLEEIGDADANSIGVTRDEDGRSLLDMLRQGTLKLETVRNDFVPKGVQSAYSQTTPTEITPIVTRTMEF